MSGSTVDLHRLDAEIQELLESLNEIDFPRHYPSPGIINSEEEKTRSLVFSIFHYQCVVMCKHIDDIRQLSNLIIIYLTPQQMSELRKALEMCVTHLSEWREIGVTNFETSLDGIVRSRVYQEREQLINSLAHNSSFAKTHYLQGYIPLDKVEAAKSIGTLAVEHFGTLDNDKSLKEEMAEAKRLIKLLKKWNKDSRDLAQTKEIRSIGKQYKNAAFLKGISFTLSFCAAIASLFYIPQHLSNDAMTSTLTKDILASRPELILPIVASITLLTSGMLFKFAWGAYQQRALYESRQKVCYVLTDFLENFKGDVNREEIIRMIAYSLFMDSSQGNSSVSEMSALLTTVNNLASASKPDLK